MPTRNSSSSTSSTSSESTFSSAFAAQDLQSVKSALDGINVSAEGVSKSLGRTFSSAIAGGRSFNDTLMLVAASMSKVFAHSVTPSLTQGFSSIIGDLFGGGGGSAGVAPFADGGIVSSPRFFGNGSSVGLMGSAAQRPFCRSRAAPTDNWALRQVARAIAPRPSRSILRHPMPKVFAAHKRKWLVLWRALSHAVSGRFDCIICGLLCMNSFHDILFPLDIALHARGGPERRTEIVTLGSNREARNARWARSRRRYEAGYGVKSLSDLATLIAFFEERRGRLYGFRWRDRADHASAPPGRAISAADMVLGTGDGVRATFQLVKAYGASFCALCARYYAASGGQRAPCGWWIGNHSGCARQR